MEDEVEAFGEVLMTAIKVLVREFGAQGRGRHRRVGRVGDAAAAALRPGVRLVPAAGPGADGYDQDAVELLLRRGRPKWFAPVSLQPPPRPPSSDAAPRCSLREPDGGRGVRVCPHRAGDAEQPLLSHVPRQGQGCCPGVGPQLDPDPPRGRAPSSPPPSFRATMRPLVAASASARWAPSRCVAVRRGRSIPEDDAVSLRHSSCWTRTQSRHCSLARRTSDAGRKMSRKRRTRTRPSPRPRASTSARARNRGVARGGNPCQP